MAAVAAESAVRRARWRRRERGWGISTGCSRTTTILQVSLSLRFKGLLLYTGGFIFHAEWCIIQLPCSFIVSNNITSVAYDHYTHNNPLLNILLPADGAAGLHIKLAEMAIPGDANSNRAGASASPVPLMAYPKENEKEEAKAKVTAVASVMVTGLYRDVEQHQSKAVGSHFAKNWCPLPYNGSVYFINTINPLSVHSLYLRNPDPDHYHDPGHDPNPSAVGLGSSSSSQDHEHKDNTTTTGTITRTTAKDIDAAERVSAWKWKPGVPMKQQLKEKDITPTPSPYAHEDGTLLVRLPLSSLDIWIAIFLYRSYLIQC